jgi:PncC family amidohydrolase
VARAELVALAERLQAVCIERGITVALAESCTGGLVAETITAVSGSSGYFLGAVVSYSNAAKGALLGVPQAMLDAFGAVSAEVAESMATGARARFGADMTASITGVAGPDGGTASKPVGLVYIAVSGSAGTEARRSQFAGDRGAIRESAARAALEWLTEHAQAVAR